MHRNGKTVELNSAKVPGTATAANAWDNYETGKNGNAQHQKSRLPLALTHCQENGWNFEEVFQYQYRITSLEDKYHYVCDQWKSLNFSIWRIEYCPKLPCCLIVSESGTVFAVVLGVAIHADGRCLSDREIYHGDADHFEAWIEDLSGRFVIVTNYGERTRFYLDPAGNLSAVYDPTRKIIASSVYLVVSGEIRCPELMNSALVLQRKGKFLFGETSDNRVKRAKPNFYIKLSDFTEHRHWPGEDVQFTETGSERRSNVQEISDRICKNISALADSYNCGLPITAGMDSRIILACADSSIDKIKSFYCYRLNRSTMVDAEVAVRIGEQIAIPILILSRRSPVIKNLPAEFEEEEYQKMIVRTGKCFPVRKDWIRYVEQTPKLDVVLRGTGLELTRANKWSLENISTACNAVQGLRVLAGLRGGTKRNASEQRRYEYLLEEYQNWLSTLPKLAHERMYDLAHIELMLPSGPVLEYSAYSSHFVVNPFNCRRLYYLTSRIAPRARMQRRIVKRLISINNRSLMKIPFHREWKN